MKVKQETVDKAKSLVATLNERGQEELYSIPTFISTGPRPLSITEQIQRLMRVEISRQAAEQGYESFEESDDFEDDEFDDAPESPYQDEKLMRPDWPGPQERKELAKNADLADLDLESPQTESDESAGDGPPRIPDKSKGGPKPKKLPEGSKGAPVHP